MSILKKAEISIESLFVKTKETKNEPPKWSIISIKHCTKSVIPLKEVTLGSTVFVQF